MHIALGKNDWTPPQKGWVFNSMFHTYNSDLKLVAPKLVGIYGMYIYIFIGKMVGAPWDGGPLIINPIYTLYRGVFIGAHVPF